MARVDTVGRRASASEPATLGCGGGAPTEARVDLGDMINDRGRR